MTIILTDGVHIFGEGATEQAAIDNAIDEGACWYDLDAADWHTVTREWIEEKLAITKCTGIVIGTGSLYFSEKIDDDD